jgi:hypothetical protein
MAVWIVDKKGMNRQKFFVTNKKILYSP